MYLSPIKSHVDAVQLQYQVHVLPLILLSHKEVDEQEQGQSSKIYFVQYFHFCTRFCRP